MLPSGDQEGSESLPGPRVTCRGSPPPSLTQMDPSGTVPFS